MIRNLFKPKRIGSTERACLDLLQHLQYSGELPSKERNIIVRQEVSFPNDSSEPNRKFRITVAMI